MTTVARFLALLELFREQAVAFEQLTPLGELTIRWTGSASGDLEISDEFDEDARRRRVGRRGRPRPNPERLSEPQDDPELSRGGRPAPVDADGRASVRWRRCC